MISVICAYQHAWAPRDPNMEKRQEFWLRLGNCVSSVPQRDLLIAGGDLNVHLAPFHPHIGHGTGVLSPERALDADTLNHLLAAHSLVVLNTWGTPGSKAHTFRFGNLTGRSLPGTTAVCLTAATSVSARRMRISTPA